MLYRHIKTGGLYVIVDTALEEASMTSVTVYRNVTTGQSFTRPSEEFHDGRFERVLMSRPGFDPVGDVRRFHEKFELTYNGKPRALIGELGRFRRQFLQEEYEEYCVHANEVERQCISAASDDANYAWHLEHMLDALADLVYVAIGTAYLHGFDFEEAWRRVQIANMAKVRATDASDSKRGSTFDVIKPPGWQAPSHIDLVEDHDQR